jgi:hypothetical protein
MDYRYKPGDVLKFFSDDTNPPKYKRHILINLEPLCWFYINSELPNFIKFSKELLIQQVKLPKYPSHLFMDHDSYIDCSEVIVYDDLTIEDLTKMENVRELELLGSLDNSIIDEIIEKVGNSYTIDPITQKRIIKSLS